MNHFTRSTLRLLVSTLLASSLAACAGIGEPSPKERLATAQAMFEKRCEKAGVKIHRTVDNVEGIYLLKVRPGDVNYGQQFQLDDPYGHDMGGDGYVESFLRGSYQANHKGTPIEGSPPEPIGYQYVEAIDPKDGKRYRYTGSIKDVTHTSSILMGGDGKTKYVSKEYVLDKVPAPGSPPRYGVTYEDISTHEEREYWIAGSSLKVIDLQTNEVIAERVGYMLDVGQGNRSGGRAPWLFAADHACPSFAVRPLGQRTAPAFTNQAGQADRLAERVLKPKTN